MPSDIFCAPLATIPPIPRANTDNEFGADCTNTTKNLRLADILAVQNQAFPVTFPDNHALDFPTQQARF